MRDTFLSSGGPLQASVTEGCAPRLYGGFAVPATVTEYLNRARECAALAEKMGTEDKTKLMEIARAWLKLAAERAEQKGLTPITVETASPPPNKDHPKETDCS